MPRPLIGDRPMTGAERQARSRARMVDEIRFLHALAESLRTSLLRVHDADTIREARAIVSKTLATWPAEYPGHVHTDP